MSVFWNDVDNSPFTFIAVSTDGVTRDCVNVCACVCVHAEGDT
jgi:hypothetical protein